MDVITNFLTDLRAFFGFSLPLILSVYSISFLAFYFFGFNKTNLRINFTLTLILFFALFILGNLKAENEITKYFVYTSDNSLGGSLGQQLQSNSIIAFYSTSLFFVLIILLSISPKNVIKAFLNSGLIFIMIVTLGIRSFLSLSQKFGNKDKIYISNNPTPQKIISPQFTNNSDESVNSSNDDELNPDNFNDNNTPQNNFSKLDSESNSKWFQKKSNTYKNDDILIKNKDNSTSYFNSQDSENSNYNLNIPDSKISDENLNYIPNSTNLNNNLKKEYLPSIDLLSDLEEVSISQEEIDETAENIKKTLDQYDVEVEIGQVQPGPVVTLYGLIPGWIKKSKKEKQFDSEGNPLVDEKGKQILKEVERKNRVKVDSIFAREKDLSLALKTPSIRIETPVLGESLVGIEVPNPNPGVIGIKSMLKSTDYQNIFKKHDSLPIALGKGSGGDNISIDLTKMPHLLIAGATGSGKSVCMNSIVSSLIYSKSPDQLRLMLVDPKRVELTQYNGIPHMISPVIVELDSVAKIFRGVINEMFKRYKLMESKSVRNISELNSKFPNSMPYLVIVIDELADLMMTSGAEIERSICRLAQLGRATGIHLVVATQRPSVDIVTGLIKSNFPSRISFSVTSSVDSRTILDTTGAEKLLGKGDMLYLPVDGVSSARLQGCFINDQEISNLVDFWKNKLVDNYNYEINIFENMENDDGNVTEEHLSSDKDVLFNDAVSLARNTKKLSISLLQRKLRIGYPRAARLMDELEEEGIVGPQLESAKSRDVIIN